MTLTVTVVVFSTFATIAVAALVRNYRARGRRRPATAYCRHPAFQPRIKHLGGMQWACSCPGCHDRAIVTASGDATARRQYSAHPCAAMPAPSDPPRK